MMDSELARPVSRNRLRRIPVVHLAFVEDVAEGVDVTRCVSMRGKGEVVRPIAFGGGAGHVVNDWVEVVRPGVRRKGASARHRLP